MDNSLEEIMTAKEVAQFTKLSESTVYKLLKNNDIPAIKFGSRYRILKTELIKWFRANSDTKIEL
jgi:excisionase family DNA binding protein